MIGLFVVGVGVGLGLMLIGTGIIMYTVMIAKDEKEKRRGGKKDE